MLTYKTFREIAIDYAYNRGNAIVAYINEQLQNIESEEAKNDNRKFEANSN